MKKPVLRGTGRMRCAGRVSRSGVPSEHAHDVPARGAVTVMRMMVGGVPERGLTHESEARPRTVVASTAVSTAVSSAVSTAVERDGCVAAAFSTHAARMRRGPVTVHPLVR